MNLIAIGLAQAEIAENEQDDDDHADDIENVVHSFSFPLWNVEAGPRRAKFVRTNKPTASLPLQKAIAKPPKEAACPRLLRLKLQG